MKKSNSWKMALFDISAIIAIIVYVAIDNDIVDGICLAIWGIALVIEIADKISRKKSS